ncbi:MAG: bifunctional 4-hydroxy-3-methylbut-2-enyl diphosphate reductase/30S ribosomal protein S1 [Clostridiales bacterium]|jgi:4-hydroxy-3-methylbut-2-enyl diphosphate reductase|nr:bifunctional 4-hydroxy-3-methylbut-2-enyl diphosphate reductase/30S ribosomal protein S1 [Clostridiales bacterium]
MEIITAKSAGFCYGVALAIKMVNDASDKGPVVCLGPIAHNKRVTEELEVKGVEIISDVDEAGERLIAIRAHGITKQTLEKMESKGLKYIDCTCRDVKAIHNIVEEESAQGSQIIICGDRNHPEIQGISSFSIKPVIYIKSTDDARNLVLDHGVKYSLVEQTTFPTTVYKEIKEILQKKDLGNIKFFDTICPATEKRQKEAEEIAKSVDKMIVLGDGHSANATKLHEICKKFCKNSYFIESIDDLELNIFKTNDKIGITAGASTPSAIIKEAVSRMSELDNNNAVNDQTFEEMLNDSIVTLHTGDVVKGTVISIVNGEVSVNLGYKSDGLIIRTEFSEDPNINPVDVLNIGDEVEVFVVRVNDGDGNVLLSKKRLEMQKGLMEIEEAFNNKSIVRGRVTEVVKGGLICMVKGVRVFVPSSQIASRFVDDLTQYVGKEYNFEILEYDKAKKRIIGGRRELAVKEENAKKEALFNSIEEGQKITGTVSRLVDFGAFVDIGGADGLIHISELGWGRVKKASDVLKQGDVVTVTVLKVDREKEKISLSMKDVDGNPWNSVDVKYPEGAIVDGRVVRMVNFGAFVELEPGLDGLVHISQIAQKHVVKPDDELKIGEIISVKVVEVDKENRKISLSKKEADGVLNPQSVEEESSEDAIKETGDAITEDSHEENVNETEA